MAERKNTLSKTLVWALLALLFVGLAGFGATSFTGTVRDVAVVGDRTVSVDEYARGLQQEIRAVQEQTGQNLTVQQLQAAGLDQDVLARLIGLAAIDNEVSQLGISIGDENLRDEIVSIPAFQGIDGKFDRQAYDFTLNRIGVSEPEFEEDIRIETARTIVQDAIVAGTMMPPAMADTIVGFIASRRSFAFARLDDETLETPVAEPDEAALQAYFDANGDEFQLPETKQITYVMLTPDMLVPDMEIEEDALRALYEDRAEEFRQPERRLVERLVFNDEAAARDAMAQIEVGGATFPQLVTRRGLELEDVDMGDVTREELEGAADGVFAADVDTVVGPLPTPLGPALFRVNGRLEARETAFEDVEEDLRAEIALERASRAIEGRMDTMNDLLAEGMTLEELSAAENMELSRIGWSAGSTEGPAAYEAFRQAAAAVSEGDYPEAMLLEDGGVFALRLDEVLPARPEPFDSAREKVAQAVYAAETQQALLEQANEDIAEMGVSGDFEAAGLEPEMAEGLTRSAFFEGLPETFMTEVFRMELGEIRTITGENAVYIVRLDEILPPEDNAQVAQIRTALQEQFDQSLAESIFVAFASDAQRRAKPEIDRNAVNAVHASFR